MSNQLRTRHLIVTLPDASGEEADALITSLVAGVKRHDLPENGFRIDHALDDAPLEGWGVVFDDVAGLRPGLPVVVTARGRGPQQEISADDARKLAALLLRAAAEAEGARA